MLRRLCRLAGPVLGSIFFSLLINEQAISASGWQYYFENQATTKKQDCDGTGIFKIRTSYYAFVPSRCLTSSSTFIIEQNGIRLPTVNAHYSVFQGWEIFGFQPLETGKINAPVANSDLTGYTEDSEAEYPRLVTKTHSRWGIETAIYQYRDGSGAIASESLLRQMSLRAELVRRQTGDISEGIGSGLGSGEFEVNCDDQIPLIESTGTPPLNLSNYTANGVNPGGMDGALNSCIWSVIGGAENDPDVNPDNLGNYFNVEFGGTDPVHSMEQAGRRFRLNLKTDGNGISQHGGLYYYQDPETDQRAIWLQPLDGLFTPGKIKARFKNNTSQTLNQLEMKYRIYRRHDQSFTIRVQTGYSVNGGDIHYQQSLTTDGLPQNTVVSECYRLVLDQLNLPANGLIVLHWLIDDNDGTGKRDEIAIGSVQLATTFAEGDPCDLVMNPASSVGRVTSTAIVSASNIVGLPDPSTSLPIASSSMEGEFTTSTVDSDVTPTFTEMFSNSVAETQISSSSLIGSTMSSKPVQPSSVSVSSAPVPMPMTSSQTGISGTTTLIEAKSTETPVPSLSGTVFTSSTVKPEFTSAVTEMPGSSALETQALTSFQPGSTSPSKPVQSSSASLSSTLESRILLTRSQTGISGSLALGNTTSTELPVPTSIIPSATSSFTATSSGTLQPKSTFGMTTRMTGSPVSETPTVSQSPIPTESPTGGASSVTAGKIGIGAGLIALLLLL